MPTYEYHCTACQHAFDAFQRMSASALEQCPNCGAMTLRRKIGRGAGIIFKGGGFYETDFKDRKGAKPAEASSPSQATPTTATAPTAAVAPAAAPAAKPAAATTGDGS
jgi:putative FmdB family regulatory protein